MFYKAQKRSNYWSKIRKKAPKVPDITCPAIDDILNQLEKQIDREFKNYERRMKNWETQENIGTMPARRP